MIERIRALTAILLLTAAQTSAEEAVFAGGCFWSLEAVFDETPGVVESLSGYTGGRDPHPSYPEVASGSSGHVEAVRVVYDPARVRYEDLLAAFARHLEAAAESSCETGPSYERALFPIGEAQEGAARAFLDAGPKLIAAVREPVVFHPAEPWLQDVHRRDPERFAGHEARCGHGAE